LQRGVGLYRIAKCSYGLPWVGQT